MEMGFWLLYGIDKVSQCTNVAWQAQRISYFLRVFIV